jgi:hypothetical protein
MWCLRILNGKFAGQIFQLRSGPTVVGRAPNCDIVISSQNISKEHARIEVLPDKVILSDLGSRNGTFVNGVQIKSQKINSGDKITLNDMIIEITDKAVARPQKPSRPRVAQSATSHAMIPVPQYDGNAAINYQGQMQPDSQGLSAVNNQTSSPTPALQQQPNFLNLAKSYFENVVMPGVYKLPEWLEFRWVLALFTLSFVVIVTCFSAIPLTRILKDSVERESQNRAKTIARNLAAQNRGAIQQSLMSALTTENADNEPGVDKAYIVAHANGEILAPPNLAGRSPSETFVNTARKFGQEAVEQIDDSTIGVLVPIAFLNPMTGATTIQAHAVVIYNMGTLAVSNEKTLGLLVQVLCLALIFGGILYYFLVRLIEYPVDQMNAQVKAALADGKTQVSVTYMFPQLQELASNVNNSVQRALSGDMGALVGNNYEFDRTNEMSGLVNALEIAAVIVNPREGSFAAANAAFNDQVARGQDWVHTKVESILEQSLRLNLTALVQTAQNDAANSAEDSLEINNVNYTIRAQGIHGHKELAYILITFNPKGVA